MTRVRNIVLPGLPVLVGAAALIASASASAVSLNPVADAFISAALPANNYGGGGALSLAAPGLVKGEFQTLMRFDAAAAKNAVDAEFGPDSWTIQTTQLRLTATSPNNAIFNTSAAGAFRASWMVNDAWIEGTGSPTTPTSDGVTFNALGGLLGGSDESLGVSAFAGGTSGASVYTLGLPSGFRGDLGAGNFVSLRLFAADTTVSYLFNSRSFGTAANRPQLNITAIATPEPAAMGVVLCGMLLAMRRGGAR